MNRRLKELAEQAGADFMRRINYNNLEGKEYEEDAGVIFESSELFEKFAELIVRECMNIADGQKKYVEDMEVFNEQDANWNRARIQQSQQIVDKIKKHFGVEE